MNDAPACPICHGNHPRGEGCYWKETLTYRETGHQEYTGNNCVFSAGFVDGHPVDTMYIKMERDDSPTVLVFLRPDEMAAIAWLASGVLWSSEITRTDKPRRAQGDTGGG